MQWQFKASEIFWAIFFVLFFLVPLQAQVAEEVPAGPPEISRLETADPVSKNNSKEVTLDFTDVDLPVLVKLISELTGKNFVIDEKVRGKISIISPSKIPVDRVYDVFLSVLELKGLAVVESGEVYLIRPFAEIEADTEVYVYQLKNMKTEEMAKVLRGLVAKPAGRRRKNQASSKGLADQVQILTDKETNTLIITATKEDYQTLTEVIEKLDQKRRQVYVEAIVMELSADKFKELGTDISGAFGSKVDAFGNNNLGLFGGVNGLDIASLTAAAANGISIGAANIQLIIRALKSSSDVNILSTPQILTTDKQKAEIVVAQNVPFPGAQSQTTGGNVQTTIERKDVGIILRLTPDVLDNQRVQMDVYQEISSVVETAQTSDGANLGPTTNKRSASTTVVVGDGQTVVIGGLIRDNIISIDRKVPFLGDIPFLGWLFHFKSDRVEKTNLMIFLTPHIILNEDELSEIKRKKANETNFFMSEYMPKHHQIGKTTAFTEMINLPK